MKKIAVVYHSGFGHTEMLAHAIVKGAKIISDVAVDLIKAEDVTEVPEKLNDYDAIIFGSPTYMGSASAGMKTFMEASSKLWFTQQWKNKIAAGFTNGHSLSGDKVNTLVQLTIFAAQHGMIWVSQVEPNGSPDGEPGKADVLNRMGSSLGLMGQSENDEPKITPPSGDIKTAECFGQHIAEVTKSFNF